MIEIDDRIVQTYIHTYIHRWVRNGYIDGKGKYAKMLTIGD